MSQTLPTAPDSLRVELPIPTGLEQFRDLYLGSSLEKAIVFVGLAVLLYLLARLARRAIDTNIEDINRRHILRKWLTYALTVLLLMVAVALFADWLSGLGTILALLIAGIAVALQDVLKSIVGWLYLSSRAGFEVGSRIEVNGIVGDVIDVGVLKTTMLEVGGELVYGRQSTGRLVTVPNYRMLSEAVHFSPASSPYVWQEVQLFLTFDSDWRRAEEVLTEVGTSIHAEQAAAVEQAFRGMERRYAFKHGVLTPIVYVDLGGSGINLTLRLLVHARARRGTVDRVSRRIFDALAVEQNIRYAYTTYRVLRAGEVPGVPGVPGVPDGDTATAE